MGKRNKPYHKHTYNRSNRDALLKRLREPSKLNQMKTKYKSILFKHKEPLTSVHKKLLSKAKNLMNRNISTVRNHNITEAKQGLNILEKRLKK